MEVPSKMLDAVASEEQISYHHRCKKLHLTHLCFADDLVGFISASPSSLMRVKVILDQFYSVFGMGISFGKNELFCCGVSLDALVATVGLHRGTLPVKYLGFLYLVRSFLSLIANLFWTKSLHA